MTLDTMVAEAHGARIWTAISQGISFYEIALEPRLASSPIRFMSSTISFNSCFSNSFNGTFDRSNSSCCHFALSEINFAK